MSSETQIGQYVGVKGTLKHSLLKEDYHWLSRDHKKDEVVHRYTGYTYGCISDDGIAVTDDNGKTFFEVPRDSVNWEK